ncbi:MAG: type IV secretion system protein [Alphaproteobacteria bacterium]|jgi:hypothetical protein|nr:type IV secretion system protein [Alphaproteobacteria bacterium]OJV12553.1 MAG: hypothetical protein BGO27_03415 [Alphaproteobacteria bacterium 33-17]
MIIQLTAVFTENSRHLVENVYQALANDFRPLFGFITIGYLIWAIYNWYKREAPFDLLSCISFVIIFNVLTLIAFEKDIFMDWVFSPINDLVYGLPQFLFRAALNTSGGSPYDTLMLLIDKIAIVTDKYSKETSSDFLPSLRLHSIMSWAMIGVIWVVYNIFFILLAIQMILANVASSILLLVAPIAISMAVFPQFRWIASNMIKGYFTYNLIPCVSIAILTLCITPITKSLHLYEQGMVDLTKGAVFSNTILIEILAMGIVSNILLSKAPEIVATLMSGAGSDVSGPRAGTLAKGAATAVSSVYRGAVSAGSYIAQKYGRGI